MEYKGAIPRDFIDSLLSRADIVEVINQRVPLKKAGATFKACCPFHQEKTPSFNVNPQKQFYHCFGCGASGDALKFVMEYEGLSFVEAVESLAAQLGLEVPRQKQTPQAAKKVEHARDLYEVMAWVAKFYRQQLRDHAASEQAKNYLRQRGLTSDIAKQFLIGFAPPGWDSLVSGLKADSQLKAQLIELGMLVEKDTDKLYDRFRNRIMFPIRDGRGRIVAFGGRVLSSEEQPKYLNSPETPIFHKSYALYGLYELRQARQSFDHIIVVEGYMDVVALAQFGVRNAVATLGTATTIDHLQMLFRQVAEVVFCFDGDSAGLKAAWKALELAIPMMEQTRSVKFLFLPDGEDPDSVVRKEGADGFKQRAQQALTLSQFWLQGLQNRLSVPIQSREGRQQLVALAQPYVQSAQGLYQYLLVEAVAEVVDLPTWRLEKQMGVKTGFSQFKSSKLGAVNSAPEVSQVMSLSKHLVCILLVRPGWAAALDQAIGSALAQSQRRDDRLLSGVLHQLMQSFEATSAVRWMQQAGFVKEYEFIQTRRLPEDEESLKVMLQEAANRLLDELEKMSLTQQSLSRQALADLQAFLAVRQ
ncbi:DNA primase [Thiomicrospira pelophila]|uniref:DNA primase n=1 Tax=Thiomicrospira pelophila TaxID=934 RepID=UPI0005701F3C|nr:DNA primase [Thiomicrospira pelophila]